MGLTYSGFIAPLLVRTFPWIVKLPIPALQAQGTTKMIVDRLTKRIIEKGVVNEKGRDILSLLMMANRDAKEGSRLSNEQLVANVNTFMWVVSPLGSQFVLCEEYADFSLSLFLVLFLCGVWRNCGALVWSAMKPQQAPSPSPSTLSLATPKSNRSSVTKSSPLVTSPTRTSRNLNTSTLSSRKGTYYFLPVTRLMLLYLRNTCANLLHA